MLLKSKNNNIHLLKQIYDKRGFTGDFARTVLRNNKRLLYYFRKTLKIEVKPSSLEDAIAIGDFDFVEKQSLSSDDIFRIYKLINGSDLLTIKFRLSICSNKNTPEKVFNYFLNRSDNLVFDIRNSKTYEVRLKLVKYLIKDLLYKSGKKAKLIYIYS